MVFSNSIALFADHFHQVLSLTAQITAVKLRE